MKRMNLAVVTIIGVLALGGFLALRHVLRPAAARPPVSGPSAATARPMDAWQTGIKLETHSDYSGSSDAKTRFLEKLRQEELRQRPWEGRN